MIDRRAVPGFAAGISGLLCAALAVVLDQFWLVIVAGLLAFLAGLFTLRLGDRLRHATGRVEAVEAQASRLEQESDVMAARAARFEAEAISARISMAQAEQGPGLADIDPDELGGMIDPETGLFNERFFVVSTEKRLSAARRGLRPLSVVLIEVVIGLKHGDPVPADPKAVAGGLLETLRDADTACRLDDGRFAMVLEDTPENGAVWTVERVRRRLADQQRGQTMWAGVACYPAHAFDPSQIIDQATRALATAKDWQQDRIEVAALPEE